MSTEHESEKVVTPSYVVGPKLTQTDINNTIVSALYTRLGDSTATVCQLTLRNGFVVEGISHCLDVANFDKEEGEKWAYKQAVDKIWDLEGYLLKERMHQREKLRNTVYEISPNRVSQWPSMEDLDNLQLQMASVDDPIELREAMATLIKGIINYYDFSGRRIVALQRDAIESSRRLSEIHSRPTNFQLTSEINTVVGNHPTSDITAWRRQAGLIRDEVVELLGHVHLDALHKFDFVEIAKQFLEAYSVCEDEGRFCDEMVNAKDVAVEFLKLHEYQRTLFTSEDLPGAGINPYAVRDDIQDILVTAYGLSHRMGFDADEDHREVYRSNMTKFDKTAAGAKATQEKYEKLGVKTRIEETLDPKCNQSGVEDLSVFFIVKVDGTQKGTDGKTYPDGKFLKSVNFEEPCYKPVIDSMPLSRNVYKIQLDDNDPNPGKTVEAMRHDFTAVAVKPGEQAVTEIDEEGKMATIHFDGLCSNMSLDIYNFTEQCVEKGIRSLLITVGEKFSLTLDLGAGDRVIPTGSTSFTSLDTNTENGAQIYNEVKEAIGSDVRIQNDFTDMLDKLKRHHEDEFTFYPES